MNDSAQVAVFASGYGGNLETCLRLARRRPDLLAVSVVVTDRPGSRAALIARSADIPLIERDFGAEVGRAGDCVGQAARQAYRTRAKQFHDRICMELVTHERRHGALAAVVFAYRRWVHGDLLERYAGRILNQHPGDLTRLDEHGNRRLVGGDPVLAALEIGASTTRTTTFLVDDGHDTGSIVAQGPRVTTDGHAACRADADVLELRQKQLSDRPALLCALLLVLQARVAYGTGRYCDGSRTILVDGHPLPFGGIDIEKFLEGDPHGLRAPVAQLIGEQLRRDLDPMR